MTTVLNVNTDAEARTAEAIRDELRRRLTEGEVSPAEVAERLGLVPVGLQALLAKSWDFEKAFRIAYALGIDFVRALDEQLQSDAKKT